MGIGGNAQKGCPGQSETDVWDRGNLHQRMGDLTDCTVLNVGLRKLVGVNVQGSYDQRDRKQNKARPNTPALGRSKTLGINLPDSHFGLLVQFRRLGRQNGLHADSYPRPSRRHQRFTGNILK